MDQQWPVQVKSYNKDQMVFTRACNAGKQEAWVPWHRIWLLDPCTTFCESFLHVTWWSGWLASLLRGLLEQQGQHQPPWNDQFLCRWRLVAEGIVAAIIYLYLMLNADIWQVISVVHGTLDEVVHWRSFNIFHSWLWSCSWDSAIREEIISETKGFKLRPAWTSPQHASRWHNSPASIYDRAKVNELLEFGATLVYIYIYTPHCGFFSNLHVTCRSGDEIDASCYRTYGFNMENHKGVSKNRGGPPKSSILNHFNKVFHYFHHPFWGTIIFGNTHNISKPLSLAKKM